MPVQRVLCCVSYFSTLLFTSVSTECCTSKLSIPQAVTTSTETVGDTRAQPCSCRTDVFVDSVPNDTGHDHPTITHRYLSPTELSASRSSYIARHQLRTMRWAHINTSQTFKENEIVTYTMRKQRVVTLSNNTSCSDAFSTIQYGIALNEPVVLEFLMREHDEFVAGRCSLLVTAPNNTVVSAILTTMSCSPKGWLYATDSFHRRERWIYCVRHINPGVEWMSGGRMASFRLKIRGEGLFTARMNIMAVVKPELGTIHTRYLTPTLGYLQNTGIKLNVVSRSWNSIVKTNTWSHLVVPGRNVVFVSVAIAGLGSLPPAKVCQHRVELYEGTMNRTVWRLCSRYHSLPQPHISYEPDLHVHYVSDWKYDKLMRGIGFRLIFTFHDKSSIPIYVTNDKWNCSTPTWTAFRLHFSCDLLIHCAGGEDEKDCPSLTQCRHDGAVWRGKCYSLNKLNPGTTWNQANAVCSSLGYGGCLVPYQPKVSTALVKWLRYDLTIYSGHVMFIGMIKSQTKSHL